MMRIEEQIKSIEKQKNFLLSKKDAMAQGDNNKKLAIEYQIECMDDAITTLDSLAAVREGLMKITDTIKDTGDQVSKVLMELIK